MLLASYISDLKFNTKYHGFLIVITFHSWIVWRNYIFQIELQDMRICRWHKIDTQVEWENACKVKANVSMQIPGCVWSFPAQQHLKMHRTLKLTATVENRRKKYYGIHLCIFNPVLPQEHQSQGKVSLHRQQRMPLSSKRTIYSEGRKRHEIVIFSSELVALMRVERMWLIWRV